MTGKPPVRAGIYCRISLAVLNDTTKVDDQARICRELCERLGWHVAEGCGYPEENGVYSDNSRSAWQRNRKRPAWDRMLADVQAGHINAIVVYHGDRLVRRPQDLAKLLDLAENKGVKLASPTGTHDLDSERMELWIRAAFAEEESHRTSERRKTQYDRWRREGRVRPGGGGGRATGFEKDGITHVPGEVAFIREAAARVLDGEGTRAIVTDLNTRGFTMSTGNPATHRTLKRLLTSPRAAGLMPDGESKAAWKPILDREIWEEVRAVLADRANGFPMATNARRYLLSGIAECGTCGHTVRLLESRGHTGKRSQKGYACDNKDCRRGVYRSQPHLDAYVTGRLVVLLNDPAFLAALSAPKAGPNAAEILALEDRKARLKAKLENIADYPDQDFELGQRALASFDRRIAELREAIAVSARQRLMTSHAGITRKDFEGLPLANRRALVAACYRVTVLPSTRRGPGFDPASVRLELRED